MDQENAIKGVRRGGQRVGGEDGSADLSGSRWSLQGQDMTIQGRGAKEYGKRRGDMKQTGNAGGGNGVSRKELERQLPAGGQRAPGARLTRYLFAAEEEKEDDESNVDDHIPGRWP